MWLRGPPLRGSSAAPQFHWVPLERASERLGFVMPGSTNTWEGIVESAAAKAEQRGGPGAVLPEAPSAAALSGNLFVETAFLEGEQLLSRSTLRVWYTEG